jgi:WD40 repeat protein
LVLAGRWIVENHGHSVKCFLLNRSKEKLNQRNPVVFAVNSLCHRALSGSVDKTLRLWDLKSGQSLRTLIGHSGSVMTVAMTPDGCHAISGSYDATPPSRLSDHAGAPPVSPKSALTNLPDRNPFFTGREVPVGTA